MSETSYVAISLASALRREMDVTANNIANANTTGFKSERLVFESYLPETEPGTEMSNFVIDKGSFLDERQGGLSQTGNPLDIAVEGDGWLSYLTPNGQRAYGRDGNLMLDNQGNLVTSSGAQVLDIGGGAIAIPPGAPVEIATDGTISQQGGGPIARIGVFTVPDLQSYRRIGGGMMVPPDGQQVQAPQPSTGSKVVQGAIEGSNVQAVLELTRMIDIQQAYDRTTKLMSTEDDLRKDALQRLGRAY